MTAIDPDTFMRHIAHYAEDTAMLHKFEGSKDPEDVEKAEQWRGFVESRRAEIRATVTQLMEAGR